MITRLVPLLSILLILTGCNGLPDYPDEPYIIIQAMIHEDALGIGMSAFDQFGERLETPPMTDPVEIIICITTDPEPIIIHDVSDAWFKSVLIYIVSDLPPIPTGTTIIINAWSTYSGSPIMGHLEFIS